MEQEERGGQREEEVEREVEERGDRRVRKENRKWKRVEGRRGEVERHHREGVSQCYGLVPYRVAKSSHIQTLFQVRVSPTFGPYPPGEFEFIT